MHMTTRLDEILEKTRADLPMLELQAAEMRKITLRRDDFRGFRQALISSEPPAIIAEVKQASPSAGVIAYDFDPVRQASIYEACGANAVSVLTEPYYFKGSCEHLKIVRESVQLPILRKDFIIHRNQLYQAGAIGADAVLLIVAALDAKILSDLYNEARDLQFDVLVEVHDLREMDVALDLGADLIGINNRNLKTFEVSIETTLQLAEEAPPDVVLVSESGIKTPRDVALVVEAGADAILVGETLMKAKDPARTLSELRGKQRV